MLPLLFLLAAGILLAGPVHAGAFQISPTLGDVPPGRSTATFRILNPGAAPMTVQVRAYRWTQSGNEDVRVSADDLIVVPPLVTLGPGKTQIVRIAHRQRDLSREAAYRVHFEEIPAAGVANGGAALQTALRIDVPLFFAPADPVGRIEWKLMRNDDRLVLRAHNVGNRFARFASIELVDESGKVVARVKGPQYALAGAAREWQFAGLAQPRKGIRLKALIDMGAVRQEVPLAIE